MSFKSRTLIAGAAITLLATSAAWAQSTAPAMGGAAPAAPAAAGDKPMSAKDLAAAFTKADANKDGKLDKIEAEGVPGLAAKFEQVDADGDKMVTKAEFEKGMK
jgi:hypothetical protein